MAFYTVFDTNVLVSSLLSAQPDSPTVTVVEKMFTGELIPVYSVEMMNEYYDVLNRKKFKFDNRLVQHILSAIVQFGLLITPSSTGEILPDIKDLPFYEVVMEKRHSDDAYLITGNIKHFPLKPFIVTPREMLNILMADAR